MESHLSSFSRQRITFLSSILRIYLIEPDSLVPLVKGITIILDPLGPETSCYSRQLYSWTIHRDFEVFHWTGSNHRIFCLLSTHPTVSAMIVWALKAEIEELKIWQQSTISPRSVAQECSKRYGNGSPLTTEEPLCISFAEWKEEPGFES